MLISCRLAFQSVLLKFVSGGAEGVGLDDVGAGADVFGVNLAHQIGIAEIQLVVAAIDVDALGIEHRAHRAVEDVDAVGFEEVSERFHMCLDLSIVDCQIVDVEDSVSHDQSTIDKSTNRQIKKSRAKQRGTS